MLLLHLLWSLISGFVKETVSNHFSSLYSRDQSLVAALFPYNDDPGFHHYYFPLFLLASPFMYNLNNWQMLT